LSRRGAKALANGIRQTSQAPEFPWLAGFLRRFASRAIGTRARSVSAPPIATGGVRIMDVEASLDDSAGRVKVWDPFVRLFHWGTAVLAASLVLTAQFGMQEVHMTLGVDLLVLVAGRLVWGVVGPRHARLARFVTGPAVALRYLGEVLRGRARRFLGHNPAGAMMVVALLVDLAALAVTGLLLQATLEFEGPLVEWLRPAGDGFVAAVGSAHAAAAYALYLLVPLHLAGVAAASWQHRENLVWAMVTGYKSLSTDER
jgi:cytochrome b